MSKLSQKFLDAWEEHGYSDSDATPEYRFHPTRKWRFDVAWPSCLVAVEIHGFGFGHQSITGVAQDCEKARAAAELGWLVVPFTSKCLGTKQKLVDAVEQVCRILSKRHAQIAWRK